MDGLLTVIVLWLSANYGLPADVKHPRIEFVSVHELWKHRTSAIDPNQLALHSVTAASGGAQLEQDDLEGIYQGDTETIYLRGDWSERSAKDVSILVHEMVHHLQNRKGKAYACPGEAEKLAYQAQDRWLAQFGTSLQGEFGLDPLSVLAKSLCL